MRRFTAAIILSMGLGLPTIATAADPTPPLWNKTCGKDASGQSVCVVEQFVLTMPQKAVVLHIRFSLSDKKDQTRMMLTAPLGILLPPGVSLSIDESKPITLPFERCTSEGCESGAVLDKDALDKFEKGKTLIVRYAPSRQGAADIPVKLEGLTNALKSLSK
jgi:invasion protein IalB